MLPQGAAGQQCYPALMPDPAFDPDTLCAFGPAQCVVISGEDARAFAQAQFSCDVRALQPSHWQWGAWLDPRGRVQALLHLADAGDGRLIALLRGGDAETVGNDLRRYVLRARVRVEPLLDRFVAIGPPLPLHELRSRDDAVGFGHGGRSLWLGSRQSPCDNERHQAFRLAEIRAGWPRLPPGSEGQFLPPALGLEHLGAVAFDKGCYPGQEIAARLHYRGGHKARLAHLTCPLPMNAGDRLALTNGTAWILEAVQVPGAFHALGVLDETSASEYKYLDDVIRVIARFDP
ncbi:MAG: folate-binding protein YgfZ [Proteobacteria bacterium]|nr:folate-binding protein YgfZ [Pseudomonadota bacterium]